MENIRIVVADDHPTLRGGIKQVLEYGQLEVVGEAADGEEAIRLTDVYQPDILLLDVNMPRVSGLEVMHRLKNKKTAVAAFSALDSPAIVLALLDAGAKGYILKDEEPQTIIKALRGIAEGKLFISLPLMMSISDLLNQRRANKNTLSEREQEVLCLIGRGRSNKQICEELIISPQTVKNHVRMIYKKRNVESRVLAAIDARELGLVFVDDIERRLEASQKT